MQEDMKKWESPEDIYEREEQRRKEEEGYEDYLYDTMRDLELEKEVEKYED